jgi:hypothetical protein
LINQQEDSDSEICRRRESVSHTYTKSQHLGRKKSCDLGTNPLIPAWCRTWCFPPPCI